MNDSGAYKLWSNHLGSFGKGPKLKRGPKLNLQELEGELPPNTGPPDITAVNSGTSTTNKNLSHVPCKFYRQGNCQAGDTCPFSHDLQGPLGNDKLPCKYFQKGNCKFGLKCALAHYLPDGTNVNYKYNGSKRYQSYTSHPIEIGTIKNGPTTSSAPQSHSHSHSQSTSASALQSASSTSHSVVTQTTWSSTTNTSPTSLLDHSPDSYVSNKLLVPDAFGSYLQFSNDNTSITDESLEDYGVFEEDYVPGSLVDMILTPQELQHRDSRSQSGTLLVRPGFEKHDDVFLME